MSTGDALLRAILLNPAEDTPRLVYADWLEENGDELRAEFVRLQCSHIPAAAHAYDDCSMRDLHCADPEKAGALAELKRLRERQFVLLDKHGREWSGIKCPACKGNYRWHMERTTPPDGDERVCGACVATGFASVRWSRGFVETVRCRMGDVLREQSGPCPECNPCITRAGSPRCSLCAPGGERMWRKWTLTPWAISVLNAHPVTRWEIADYAPASGYAFGGFGFFASALPQPVFLEIQGHKKCATEIEAVGVLANGVGRVARRLVGLPPAPVT